MNKPIAVTLDPAGTKLVCQFEHEIPLMSCVIDPTGRWCFAGGRGRKLYVTDIAVTDIATSVITARDEHESWVVTSARWGTPDLRVVSPRVEQPPQPSEDDRSTEAGTDGPQALVVTGDLVGRLVAWDTLGRHPKVRWSIDTGHGTLRTVAISNDGQHVATAGGDGLVKLWSCADGECVRTLAGHACPVFSAGFHPDGSHLLTGDRGDQKIKQWDYHAGREVREFDAQDLSNYKGGTDINYGGVRDLAFTPDGTVMICCGRDSYGRPGLVLHFDWETGQQIRKQVSTFASSIFHHVAFHPQGFLVASGVGAQTGEIWFWKPDQDQKLASLKVTGPAYGMDLHPDGRHIAVAQMTGPSTYGDKGVVGLYEMPLYQLGDKPPEPG